MPVDRFHSSGLYVPAGTPTQALQIGTAIAALRRAAGTFSRGRRFLSFLVMTEG